MNTIQETILLAVGIILIPLIVFLVPMAFGWIWEAIFEIKMLLLS